SRVITDSSVKSGTTPEKILTCLTCPAMTACETPAARRILMHFPRWPSDTQWRSAADSRAACSNSVAASSLTATTVTSYPRLRAPWSARKGKRPLPAINPTLLIRKTEIREAGCLVCASWRVRPRVRATRPVHTRLSDVSLSKDLGRPGRPPAPVRRVACLATANADPRITMTGAAVARRLESRYRRDIPGDLMGKSLPRVFVFVLAAALSGIACDNGELPTVPTPPTVT